MHKHNLRKSLNYVLKDTLAHDVNELKRALINFYDIINDWLIKKLTI